MQIMENQENKLNETEVWYKDIKCDYDNLKIKANN